MQIAVQVALSPSPPSVDSSYLLSASVIFSCYCCFTICNQIWLFSILLRSVTILQDFKSYQLNWEQILSLVFCFFFFNSICIYSIPAIFRYTVVSKAAWLLPLHSKSSVQSLSHVWLFVIPWTAAHQASLSITNTRSPPKPMSIESVMPFNHLILCCPLFLLPSILPIIRIFSNELALRIRWPKYWSLSFNISPSNEHPRLISFRMDWLDLLEVQWHSGVFSNTTIQKHQFFSAQLSL